MLGTYYGALFAFCLTAGLIAGSLRDKQAQAIGAILLSGGLLTGLALLAAYADGLGSQANCLLGLAYGAAAGLTAGYFGLRDQHRAQRTSLHQAANRPYSEL